jgi:hypothetical protein
MGNQPILYSTDRAIARNFVEKRLVIEYLRMFRAGSTWMSVRPKEKF